MGICRKLINTKNMEFVTGIFTSSIICLIWQNMVQMKQKVQANRNMLTGKPAGYEGLMLPGRTLGFVTMHGSDLSATTTGSRLPKALLKFSPVHGSGFLKHVIPDVQSPFETSAASWVSTWGLNSDGTNHSKLITWLQACYCLTVLIRYRRTWDLGGKRSYPWYQ